MARYYHRVKAEAILLEYCPVCGAPPGQYCHRRPGEFGRQGKALLAAGKPSSHTERMWLAQGHGPAEFESLWEGMGKKQPKNRITNSNHSDNRKESGDNPQ